MGCNEEGVILKPVPLPKSPLPTKQAGHVSMKGTVGQSQNQYPEINLHETYVKS